MCVCFRFCVFCVCVLVFPPLLNACENDVLLVLEISDVSVWSLVYEIEWFARRFLEAVAVKLEFVLKLVFVDSLVLALLVVAVLVVVQLPLTNQSTLASVNFDLHFAVAFVAAVKH